MKIEEHLKNISAEEMERIEEHSKDYGLDIYKRNIKIVLYDKLDWFRDFSGDDEFFDNLKDKAYKEFLDITLLLGKLIALDTNECKIEKEVIKAIKGQDNLIFNHYLYGLSIPAFISDTFRDFSVELKMLQAHFKNRLISYLQLGLPPKEAYEEMDKYIKGNPDIFNDKRRSKALQQGLVEEDTIEKVEVESGNHQRKDREDFWEEYIKGRYGNSL